MSSRTRNWTKLTCGVGIFLCSSFSCYADVTLARGPYLQSATANSMVIVWRTHGESEPVVRYGDKARSLDAANDPSSVTVRVSSDVNQSGAEALYRETDDEKKERHQKRKDDPTGERDIYQYEVTLSGLSPDTQYFYGVYDGKDKLAGGDRDHHFTTSPSIGTARDTRIWVVGDSGTGGKPQREVRDAMFGFIEDTGRPLDTYIHVGDMAYTDGANYEFDRGFFGPYEDILRSIVVWPSMGNHEGYTSRGLTGKGPYYDAYVLPTQAEAGGVASGSEAYYSYDIGRIHFVCLDSHDLNRKSSGPMAQWLREDLNATQQDWLIAFWHHPPYTKGSHDSDKEGQLIEMREEIMPILEGSGVDIVLTGHSHIYERSMLMDGAYATPTVAEGVILDDGDGNPDGDGAYRKSAGLNPHEGTVQIVAGHGGAGVRRTGTMPVMREIIVENGSVILDVDGDTLVGHMINREEVIRDVFSIVKSGKVEVERVKDPWQPKK